MGIEGIKKSGDYIKPLNETGKNGRHKVKTKSEDKIEISPEAKEKVKLLKLLSGEPPELREKKIQEVKERISKEYYDKESVKKEAVDNLLKFFLS